MSVTASKTVVVCGFSACDMRKCAIKNCCKLYGRANWQVTEEVIQPRLVSRQGTEVAGVPLRCDEQMARRVRELVHHDERGVPLVDEKLRLRVAEDAAVELVRVLDVLESPRCPQGLGHQSQRL